MIGERFNRLVGLLGPNEVGNVVGERAGRQAPTRGFLLVTDGLLDLSMQHVVAGQD